MNETRSGQRSAEAAPPAERRKWNAAQVAVVALVLVVGSALGLRFLRQTSPPLPTSPAARPLASVAAPLLPSNSSAGSLALRWIKLEEQTTGKDAAAQELLRSQERALCQELRQQLGQDSSRWTDVLEVLSGEDPREGRKLVGDLREAVDAPAEGVLGGLLKNGRHRETRLASATLLGSRASIESLWSLVMAAQEDADSGVRYRALSELASRQSRASASDSATIDQLLRLRSQVDPDADVRNFALRVTGQPAGAPTGPPPRPLKKK